MPDAVGTMTIVEDQLGAAPGQQSGGGGRPGPLLCTMTPTPLRDAVIQRPLYRCRGNGNVLP
ncbi:MAG: hypothetical protein OXR67_00100 [Chloroflexota bacterium]|nr:hypothetical protein [Chloroflexota bacterium]